jgi:hypothetical protein
LGGSTQCKIEGDAAQKPGARRRGNQVPIDVTAWCRDSVKGGERDALNGVWERHRKQPRKRRFLPPSHGHLVVVNDGSVIYAESWHRLASSPESPAAPRSSRPSEALLKLALRRPSPMHIVHATKGYAILSQAHALF